MGVLKFSGHESFQCRNLWLKKGYEFVINDGDFNDELAVVSLGVGSNMVTSIRFWMRAFGLIDEDGSLSTQAAYLFDEEGVDPYLEDIGTLWLLHLYLVRNERASIYSLFFNEFRKQRIEFSKDQLKSFIIQYCEENDAKFSENVLERDIGVFIKNYVKPTDSKSNNLEDDYASLLVDLELVRPIHDRKDWFVSRTGFKDSLPKEIFLYSILIDDRWGESISLSKLLNEPFSPGLVFTLDADSMVNMISALSQKYDEIVYKDDAGIRELQISNKLTPQQVLKDYYNG